MLDSVSAINCWVLYSPDTCLSLTLPRPRPSPSPLSSMLGETELEDVRPHRTRGDGVGRDPSEHRTDTWPPPPNERASVSPCLFLSGAGAATPYPKVA